MAAKDVVLERVDLAEETAAASLVGCTLEKTNLVCKNDESHAMLERLNTDLATIRKQVSSQATVQSDLGDAQDSSFWFEALCKSVREHSKASVRHHAEGAEQPTVDQAKLACEKSHSRAFQAALLNAQHANEDQSPPFADTHQFPFPFYRRVSWKFSCAFYITSMTKGRNSVHLFPNTVTLSCPRRVGSTKIFAE